TGADWHEGGAAGARGHGQGNARKPADRRGEGCPGTSGKVEDSSMRLLRNAGPGAALVWCSPNFTLECQSRRRSQRVSTAPCRGLPVGALFGPGDTWVAGRSERLLIHKDVPFSTHTAGQTRANPANCS